MDNVLRSSYYSDETINIVKSIEKDLLNKNTVKELASIFGKLMNSDLKKNSKVLYNDVKTFLEGKNCRFYEINNKYIQINNTRYELDDTKSWKEKICDIIMEDLKKNNILRDNNFDKEKLLNFYLNEI